MSWHKKGRWWVVFTRRPIRSGRSLTTSRSIIIWWRMAKVYEAQPPQVVLWNLLLIRLASLLRECVHPWKMRPLGRRSIINAPLKSNCRKHLMTNWNRVVLPPRYPRIIRRSRKLRRNKDSLLFYIYVTNSTADDSTLQISRGYSVLFAHEAYILYTYTSTKLCKVILSNFQLMFCA